MLRSDLFAAIDAGRVRGLYGGYWEPLMACYSTSLISRVAQHLEAANGAMWKLLEASRGIALPLPNDWPARVQVYSLAELNAATDELKRQTGADHLTRSAS